MSLTTGSNRARRIALRLLRVYPRPWRLRYEREMRALLEEMPVRWSQVANLGRYAVREWLSVRALGWPARSAAGRVRNVRFLTFLVIGYGLDGLSRVVAYRLTGSGLEISDNLRTGAALITLAFALRVLVEQWARLSKSLRAASARRSGLFQLPDWELAVWAVVMGPAMVFFYADTPPDYLSRDMIRLQPYVHLLQIFTWTMLASMSSARTQRLTRIESSVLKKRLRSFQG